MSPLISCEVHDPLPPPSSLPEDTGGKSFYIDVEDNELMLCCHINVSILESKLPFHVDFLEKL